MTGNVFFPSVAGASPSTRATAAPAYSIDAFSEFSCFAVSRTSSTTTLAPAAAAMDPAFELRTTLEQDEELFRDLFAADSDWDAPVALKLSQKKAVVQQQPKPHVWNTGGGSPFLTAAFGPFLSQPASAVHKAEPPTLSAPVPRLNLAELMNARPGDSCTNVWGGALCQLLETAEEENDDDGNCEDRPESNAKPKVKSSASALKLKSCSKLKVNAINSSNSSSAKLQQETLSFLERLDLKALLHTPRPDVLDFYPTNSNGAVAGSAATSQFVKRGDDSRVENEHDPGILLATNNNSVKSKSKSLSKKDPTATTASSSSEVAMRLSHMELTYGMTKSEPRKTRKATIDRLANPILGFTSTLQALSPNQRRKREMTAMDEEAERGWSNCVAASPVAAKLKRKDPLTTNVSTLIHLSSAAQSYEAAASSSSTRRLQKSAVRERASSNNQLEDERDNSNVVIPVKRNPADRKNGPRSLNARKAALKKKIEDKQRDRSNQSSADPNEPFSGFVSQDAGAGTTFLTQHEDEEEKLQSRAKRASQQQLFSRPPLPPQISASKALRQPRRPVSVRVAKPESSGRAPSSRSAGNRKPSEEREPESKNGSKATGLGSQREAQKLRRPQANRQQPVAPTGPRKPSNGETGRLTGRRPFARSNTGNAHSSGILPQVEPSAPKRKLSIEKPSVSAMVLMGTASLAGSTNSAASRRGMAPSTSRPAKNAQTSKKAPNNQSFSGSATPKYKPATERTRRPSKESSSTSANSVSDRLTAKSSVELPSIRPPSKSRQLGETSARRGNAVYRRAKARAD